MDQLISQIAEMSNLLPGVSTQLHVLPDLVVYRMARLEDVEQLGVAVVSSRVVHEELFKCDLKSAVQDNQCDPVSLLKMLLGNQVRCDDALIDTAVQRSILIP